jgi:pre-rRNA-processing protein TSR3
VADSGRASDLPSATVPPGADPPTIVVVHPRENRRKCSVEPLRARSEFRFWTFPVRGPEPTAGYVRLGIGGPLLSAADRGRGLLVLDGTWRWAARMEPFFAEFPVRSLPPWQTAYPRRSKREDDPPAGLATIEAIYAAFIALRRDPAGLLDHYRWAAPFLEVNRQLVSALS